VADDVQLIGRVAARDADAFALLFDRHAPAALGLLVRVLGDRGLAEEVLQDAFLQVWRQADRYRPGLATPRGWIFLLARSRALDCLRSRQARARREEEVGRQAGQAGSGLAADAAVGLEEAERRRVVAGAVATLPAEQRQAVELAFFAGLTHSQIASRLGAPLGTVKSRILLGMNKLRQALASYSS
jgi:RNA polymerase sigma-70 factor (ECF subfamily)